MATNIFSNNKPVKHVGRNGFDLSSAHTFVMRPAVLRPVIFQHTVPDSSYKINCADIVRTSSLQTAAFLRGKHDLDFFFVPYSQLYSESNHVIFGRGDKHTPLSLDLQDDRFPSVSLAFLIASAAMPYFVMRYCNHISPDSLYYNNLYACFQRVFGDFGFRAEWIQSNIRTLYRDCLYNPAQSVASGQPVTSYSYVGADCLQLLSSLGYGDYFAYCNDIVNTHFPATPFVTESESSTALLHVYHDFVNFLFQLDDLYVFDEWDSTNGTRFVNVLNLCAYQKVFMDFYRDSVNDSDTSVYVFGSSCDYSLATVTCFSQTLSKDVLTTLLRPRTRMYFKDLSCGTYENSQFGDQAKAADIVGDGSAFDFTSDQVGSVNLLSTATNVRFTLALQRYRETLLRAGSRTKDLLMSEFGVKSRYIDDTYVHHLGSFDGALELNKVSATAEMGTYSVGDLAANMFSSLQGQTIDFTCNDHGILIGVMSFYPIPMHNSFGISPFVTKTRQFDFYHSEFENLGLQPVSSHLFSPFAYDNNGAIGSKPETLGFSARYFEYKQNLDLVHDGFNTAELMPDDATLEHTVEAKASDGPLSNYVVVKPVNQSLSLIKNRSYMLPSVMDTIFSEVDNGDVLNAHFNVSLQCSISAVLPMSVLGL